MIWHQFEIWVKLKKQTNLKTTSWILQCWKFRLHVSTTQEFYNTLTDTATCVSCLSSRQLRGTIDKRLFNQQTSNTDRLKSQLQSRAHKNPTPAHKHLWLSHSFSLSVTHTHSKKLYQSTGPMVEVHVQQLYVACQDLFSVGLSSMKPCQPVS